MVIYSAREFLQNGLIDAFSGCRLVLISRRVPESFTERVRFPKFRAGLPKHSMLNVILDLFKVPSYEYVQITTSTM